MNRPAHSSKNSIIFASKKAALLKHRSGNSNIASDGLPNSILPSKKHKNADSLNKMSFERIPSIKDLEFNDNIQSKMKVQPSKIEEADKLSINKMDKFKSVWINKPNIKKRNNMISFINELNSSMKIEDSDSDLEVTERGVEYVQ